VPICSRQIRAVQAAYPRIYLACHVRHVRRASTAANVTSHEASILAHLDFVRPQKPTDLAAHLGVSKSTLSAALKRLAGLGYVARVSDTSDRRSSAVRLTRAGAHAMNIGNVLDAARLRRLLGALTADERRRAVDGIELLARAANVTAQKAVRS
jgi:DNA-binding MarR family transcriptional regulator